MSDKIISRRDGRGGARGVQQPGKAQRRVARHVAGVRAGAGRVRGRRRGPCGGALGRRRQGVRLGRGHLEVRGRALERRGGGALRCHHGAGLRQAPRVPETDDRADHGQLRRRRGGARGVLRPAHLRRELAVCHSRGEARGRLRLRRAAAPGRPDRASLRQGDVVHRAPVLRRRSVRDGPGQPGGGGWRGRGLCRRLRAAPSPPTRR